MIVVAGEALIDLVPRGELLAPLPGGSPFNVAVGLARLGADVGYLGRLSRDGFGRRLRASLRAEGVSTALTDETPAPTTLAVVHLDGQGRAEYGFYLEGTSAHGLRPRDLPDLPPGAVLHVSLGAVTLATRPAGPALAALIARERGRRPVCLDPNVRPAAVDDLEDYRRRVAEAVGACDVVKVSEEDLRALHPEQEPETTAARWRALGPALVVVTRGADGAVALGAAGRVEVPGEPVRVVDTVGAGDAFTAGLLARLESEGALDRPALEALTTGRARAALHHATRVAAATCARLGADPPRTDELTA